jgi:hypothetical protein
MTEAVEKLLKGEYEYKKYEPKAKVEETQEDKSQMANVKSQN